MISKPFFLINTSLVIRVKEIKRTKDRVGFIHIVSWVLHFTCLRMLKGYNSLRMSKFRQKYIADRQIWNLIFIISLAMTRCKNWNSIQEFGHKWFILFIIFVLMSIII